MSYWLGVAQISSKISKAWSAWAAVTWWGHIHMHIHSIWRLSNTLYMYGIDVWCEMNMVWVYSLNHRISPSLIGWELPRFLVKKIAKAWSSLVAVTVTWWGHIHMHIQSIWTLSNTPYVWHWCEMNMGWVYSLNHRLSRFGSTASITAFHHHLLAKSCLDF